MPVIATGSTDDIIALLAKLRFVLLNSLSLFISTAASVCALIPKKLAIEFVTLATAFAIVSTIAACAAIRYIK